MIIDRNIDEFYELSFADISLYIQGYAAREKRQSQKEASNMYILAQLVGINVAQLFSKDAKVPSLEKIFPHLFSEEYEDYQEDENKLCKAEATFLAGIATHLLDRVNIDIKDKDM